MRGDEGRVRRFWEDFRKDTRTSDVSYKEWVFGDHARWSDELCRLVMEGRKRATAKLRAEADKQDLSGGLRVVVDGSGRPSCVVEITDIQVRPFAEVDEEFAREEGEGDLSLQYWREVHTQFFLRRAHLLGIEFNENVEVVLTRFEKVWPERLKHIKEDEPNRLSPFNPAGRVRVPGGPH